MAQKTEDSTALVPQTRQDLTKYSPAEYNVLSATAQITAINPYHAITISVVQIDADPNGSDVYKQGSRNIAPYGQKAVFEDVLVLSKRGLQLLADAGGVIWDPRQCGRVGDRLNRNYVEYEAVGGVRMPDGSTKWVKGTKHIDMENIVEETTADWQAKIGTQTGFGEKKHTVTKEEAERNTQRDITAYRKNFVERCETGAKERVIRELMNPKGHYSPEELRKPFVIPRIEFCLDMSDPEQRALALKGAGRATQALYGGTAEPEAAASIEGKYKPVEVASPAAEEIEDLGEEEESEVVIAGAGVPVKTDTGEVVEEAAQEIGESPSGPVVEGEIVQEIPRADCIKEIRALIPQLGWDDAKFIVFVESEFGVRGTGAMDDDKVNALLSRMKSQKEAMP